MEREKMSFTKNYMTKKGLELCAKLVKGGELRVTRVLGGDGAKATDDYSSLTELANGRIAFETNRGVLYDENEPDRLTIPIYYDNAALAQGFNLTEIGVFAEDPDEGDILLCVVPGYAAPLPLPGMNEGRLELTMDLILQLSLAEEVQILLPPSLVYLTKSEADALYWRLDTQYPATWITETNGETVEAHQRWQDAEIEALRLKTDAGTTAADTRQVPSDPRENWNVKNHWGIYDAVRGVFYA